MSGFGVLTFVAGTAVLLGLIKRCRISPDPRDDHWRNTRRPS